MFPDWFVFRVLLRIAVLWLDAIAPLSILWTVLAIYTWPAPPFIVLPNVTNEALLPWDTALKWLTVWTTLESIWRVVHGIGRYLITSGLWDYRGEREPIDTEERWRLWRAMLESSEDPWSDHIGGMFLRPGAKTAPRGAKDPNVTSVRMQDVGRTNVAEFIAHYMFDTNLKNIRKGSIEAAEIHSMILLLEAKCRHTFKKGRSAHQPFLLYNQPIVTAHHPLSFYAVTSLLSELGSLALFAWGFRYYGPRKTWPFPLLALRASRKAIDKHLQIDAELKAAEPLSEVIGYWHHPGSKKAQSEATMPIMFFHGISGTYGPALFLIFLQWMTGRPMFVPEMPYVFMRLAPPSMILLRPQIVAASRRMMFRHGYTLSASQDAFDEHWRRGKAVVLGHSLGGAPTSWLLRDAPDLVGGTVLLEPMSILLFSADPARNFFRTKCVTAGEIFFKAFSQERGISHYLSRHIRWIDSVTFAPKPVEPFPSELVEIIPECAREPLEVPYDIPNYAPYVTPCPQGPHPTIVFYGSNDCILPVAKIEKYLLRAGFTKDAVRIMPGLEHAGILIRPGWIKEVVKAVDDVAAAADQYYAQEEDEDESTDEQEVEQPAGKLLEDVKQNVKKEEEDEKAPSLEPEKVANGHAS